MRQTLPRLDALIAEGVTTVEIKSGYGLDLANERKSLRAGAPARRASGRSAFARPFSAPTRCRRKPRATSDGYIDAARRGDAAGARRAKAWPTRSTAFARASPFRPTRSRACSTRRAGARPAGQAARRPAVQSARRGAGGAVRRAVGRSSRTYRRRRRRGDGGGRNGRRPAARRLLFHPRDQAAADRAVPPPRRRRWRWRPTAIPALRR